MKTLAAVLIFLFATSAAASETSRINKITAISGCISDSVVRRNSITLYKRERPCLNETPNRFEKAKVREPKSIKDIIIDGFESDERY